MKKLLFTLMFLKLNAFPIVDDYLDYKYCIMTSTPTEICTITREIESMLNKYRLGILSDSDKRNSAKIIIESYSVLNEGWKEFLFKIRYKNGSTFLIDEEDIKNLSKMIKIKQKVNNYEFESKNSRI